MLFPQFISFDVDAPNCSADEVVALIEKFANTNNFHVTQEVVNPDVRVVSIFDSYETFVIDIKVTKKENIPVVLSIKCFACPFEIIEKLKTFTDDLCQLSQAKIHR